MGTSQRASVLMSNLARPTAQQRRTAAADSAPGADNNNNTDFASRVTGSTTTSPSRSRAQTPRYGDKPPPYSSATTSTTAAAVTAISTEPISHGAVTADHHHQLLRTITQSSGPASASSGPTQSTSVLRPRVAVVLGISTPWQVLLFISRLGSIVPGVWLGLPCVLRLVYMVFSILVSHHVVVGSGQHGFSFGRLSKPGSTLCTTSSPSVSTTDVPPSRIPTTGFDIPFETSLRITETLLATIWCVASSYLSFFFTDCLMSRWLLNYTPQATIVRLLAISALNGWCTWGVLYLTGGSEDPRLLLPGWIVISTTLTLLYHLTQRKINIRKETRASISAFSIASFISMVALLAQLHSNRTDYPDIPLVTFLSQVWGVITGLALKIMEYGNVTRDL
ncbi:N-glycosylation protein-domain-containing protein [Triangularia verruculosa]|uniref:N-glycosylation protein-domain-containing protein n=1 Tax=Triangularia verruculosa TaxID=2587418 RepID=A0AAN6XIM9_9PEZI|nr:N-glycosylation protein-domain-containing protein [Triangularia verruculosa]